MKRKWVKDYCPYSKAQGFYAIVGNVDRGQKVFGFSHTLGAANEDLVLATKTRGAVHQMDDTGYEVEVVKTSAGSVATVVYITSKTVTQFNLRGENGQTYDIVVVGNVDY
jgi:hypothetical protein